MTEACCRLCRRALFEAPLLRYTNMPRVAQFLPDASSVQSDRGMDLTIRQCSGCGLVQLTDDPVSYYKDVIRASGLSPEMRAFRDEQFRGFLERFSLAGKKVVEIGCGRGEYLSVLKAAGADAIGLEHSEASVAACRAAGLNVSQGFVGSAEEQIAGAPFDAFLILNFLEHHPDPNTTLRGIHGQLRDGGMGLVEVPNFDMMLHERQFAEFMSDHLSYFTKDTLTTALSINGFEMVSCTEEFHRYILSAVVRKRRILNVSDFDAQQARRRDEVHAYVRRFAPKSVAIWGAGHQALALMSLLDLGDKIRYVVDSAPFKQGRFTPATHLPIVAPSALATDPVEAVIVIAAGYSDEVARIIRSTCSPHLDVSIWRESGLEPA
ncbi:MAG: class I SAM-dependent methyltransferase [Vicinamibacterales bacterium]